MNLGLDTEQSARCSAHKAAFDENPPEGRVVLGRKKNTFASILVLFTNIELFVNKVFLGLIIMS